MGEGGGGLYDDEAGNLKHKKNDIPFLCFHFVSGHQKGDSSWRCVLLLLLLLRLTLRPIV